ncbi:replication protein [Providencia alcalifaciens]|uniref:replication protein n=1 Tax=Providencia alcalifaciens TaxID=126385 RepID=UPI000D993157|nr:replication protein [Providencia alcalifaciens]MTC27964.1 replication protein [Providencia alcalifaciens]SPY71491.1 phage replication protein O, N-terminal domain [Providencia alcalifaciens]
MLAEVKYLDNFRPKIEVTESKVADLDNGYTRIANELLEAVMLANLTQHQLLVFFAIARKTYGYNKKSDWVGNEQLSKLTGMLPHKCSAAKSELVSRGILLAEKRHVSINKNIHEWKEKQAYPKKVSLPESGKKTLPESGKSDYPNQVNTKDNTTKEKKENKNTMSEEVRSTDEKSNSEPTKQDPFIEPFEKIFWIAGMRKVGKDKSKTAFKSKFKEWRKETGGSIDEFAKFLADDIQCRLRTQQFGFDKMHPTTYLNGSRWTDEKPELSQSTTQKSSITVSKNGLVFY